MPHGVRLPGVRLCGADEMFFWFLVAVALVIGLTLLGAFIARRDPGTNWEGREDRPIGPWMEH